MDNHKNIVIGVLLVAVIVGAYFLGRNEMSVTSPVPTQVETSTQKEVVREKEAEPTFVVENNKGQACKKIATDAAKDNSGHDSSPAMLLRSNYDSDTDTCYYELNAVIDSDGAMQRTIRMSPNDDWIAYCTTATLSDGSKLCGRHNVGLITEAEYNRLAALYFSN